MQKNSAIASKVLGASLLFLVLTGCGKQQPEAQAPPPAVPVEVKNLGNNQVQSSSEFVGSLEAKQRVALAPRVAGRVIQIAVQEGDTVKKGDLILELQLDREQGEVEAAQSEVSIQRANVSDAEAELSAVEAEVASAEAAVQQSQADLREQEARLKLAQTNLERAKFLVKQGAQSQQSLDNSIRDLNAAKAQTDALKAAVNSSQKTLAATRARVNSARAAIAGQKAALQQAEARVGIATDNLDFNRLTAPIDGVVGDIQPKVGDYVQVGAQVTSITQDNALELNINVPIEQAGQLKLGLPVEVVDRQSKAIAEGDISFISPRADRNSQGVLVKAAINNNGQLKDDTVVNARVIWSEQQGILIPTESISRLAGKSFVFVAVEQKQKDGKTAMVAKQKPVELGAIQGQSYQVLSGLKPSDRLITSGILNLTDGALITTEAVATQSAQTSNQ
ncbi:MAG: efflux RND transporter periplasmic adaptor subunit [Pleurocapsa minor HA4230-MV1]|jgi:RND family efflux transporter MFP subunit|nr:efflux RND transporter periplasmic adaptor subunit [Pleurocapsa minor HA4230-MV1]